MVCRRDNVSKIKQDSRGCDLHAQAVLVTSNSAKLWSVRTYILSISTKRFTFSQPTVVINVFDEISDLEFVSDPL